VHCVPDNFRWRGSLDGYPADCGTRTCGSGTRSDSCLAKCYPASINWRDGMQEDRADSQYVCRIFQVHNGWESSSLATLSHCDCDNHEHFKHYDNAAQADR